MYKVTTTFAQCDELLPPNGL